MMTPTARNWTACQCESGCLMMQKDFGKHQVAVIMMQLASMSSDYDASGIDEEKRY